MRSVFTETQDKPLKTKIIPIVEEDNLNMMKNVTW